MSQNYSTYTTPFLIADVVQAPKGSWDSIPTFTQVNNVTVSAAFEVQTAGGALLIPRLPTSVITGGNFLPCNGMIVYDTTVNAFKAYQSNTWEIISTNSATLTATYILQTPSASLPNAQALSALSSGILKSATGTGVVSIALAGTDYYSPGNPTTILDTKVNGNFFIGTGAGNASLTGTLNSSFGYNALHALTSGNRNTAGGYLAGSGITTGSDNCVYGYDSAPSISTQSFVTAFGSGTLQSNIEDGNSAFGYQALKSNTFGTGLCAFGYQALTSLTSFNNSSAFGYQALMHSTSDDNSAFGFLALGALTSGDNNCAFGSQAAASLTTGTAINAFGIDALFSATTAINCDAFGESALFANVSGNDNTAFGYESASSTTGSSNAAFGSQSLFSNTSGNNNVAVGYKALYSSTTINESVAIGGNALTKNTTGQNNVAVGYNALTNMVTSGSNTAIGHNSLSSNTADGTTALGANSGSAQGSYTHCTFLGAGADASVNGLTNAIAIGYNASVSTSNSMVLGNGVNVGIGLSNPASPLHVFGTIQQRGYTGTFDTGTDLYRGQAAVQTNNTNQTLLTVPVATSPDTATFVKVDILSIKVDGSSSGYGSSSIAAWYNGTTTAAIGSVPGITMISAGGVTFSAAWSISGNNIVLTANAVSFNQLQWLCSYEYFSINTSDL